MNIKNKYTLSVEFSTNKKIDGDILWKVIKDAFLSYTKQARAEVIVHDAFIEERK